MSSLEIAELTYQHHKSVLRDIDTMMLELGRDISKSISTYLDSQQKSCPYYQLPLDLLLELISGYSIPLRHKIIKRWVELEDEAKRFNTSGC